LLTARHAHTAVDEPAREQKDGTVKFSDFYYNAITGTSQWEAPAAVAEAEEWAAIGGEGAWAADNSAWDGDNGGWEGDEGGWESEHGS